MAHYAIGDIQGCYDEFRALLHEIDFQYGKDTLWLAGDVVNRGPKSLETLAFIMKHEDSMQMVLGNHDLHLLAVAFGAMGQKKGDTIEPIIKSKQAGKMLTWLRHQPLMLAKKDTLMVHAGLLPQWSAKKALSLASEVESVLRGPSYKMLVERMYGNKPKVYRKDLQGMDRLRLIVNVMTRIRAITYDNELDFSYKGPAKDMPSYLQAWFSAKNKRYSDYRVVFGHWSSLGLYMKDNVLGLDTGVLWGGKLTAINLKTHKIKQVPNLTRGIALMK